MRWRQPVYSIQTAIAPVTLPVSLPEVKARLDIADTDDTNDAELMALIRASTDNVEKYLRRSLIDRTLTMFLDRFPGKPLPWWDGVREIADTELTDLTEPIMLPLPPIDSVVYVKAHKQDNSEVTVAATEYFVDKVSEPGRIMLRIGSTWPLDSLRVANGVEVQYVAGYGPTGSNVPEPIREAIMTCVTDMNSTKGGEALKFEKVGDSSLSRFAPDETGSVIPRTARNLLSTYRIWRI